MKSKLTIRELIDTAIEFCQSMSKENHSDLLGVTDGKTIGTYIEHRFKDLLIERFDVEIGNSAEGIDLPDEEIITDIKVTSITQPQSSCPYKDARQKIYGLGYNLLVFVYEKEDLEERCIINFVNCTFIDQTRTGDFTLTKRLKEMLLDGANKDDIISYLNDRNVPGDDLTYNNLAKEILSHPPVQGYLTISNALQWRLQYNHAIKLQNTVDGVVNYEF